MQTIVFDLETGPLAESELSALLPPFDPAEVKTGNLKDPAKIAEKIAEAEANHRRDFIERAALDPLTGRVVAIGVMTFDARGEVPTAFGKGGKFFIIGHDDEARTLFEFWELTRGEMGRMNPMIGFNIFGFDLPFLFRRSWKHRVPVPFGLRRGRYWSDQLIDLRDCLAAWRPPGAGESGQHRAAPRRGREKWRWQSLRRTVAERPQTGGSVSAQRHRTHRQGC